jgi:serine phosphatase RsbU (regulator of sigma subunit)
MFPPPFTGHISFEYEYLPIHEIGGDYVHVNASADTGNVTLTLLDVAGHGLAAALTVNRLFGELERILAENASACPGEIMALLNRYINLTMARHSLFATGMCMTVEPTTGRLEWVSAGHPPAFVRHTDGSVTDMATTTMLLGVLESDEFESKPRKCTLNPGDVVIAFTDGAFEARDAQGERFGMDRLRETARFDPPPRSWPRFIANAVAKHHAGHAEDDVLIAALTLRSLRVPEADERGIDSVAAAGANP